MEQRDDFITDICNENTDQFPEMTEESDGGVDGLVAALPTTMLTPPPTGEPLLNGSSLSSVSGNDLQHFTADELSQESPNLSEHTDESNSNQSGNSDSADSKLVINEASVDLDDVNYIVNSKKTEAIAGSHPDSDNQYIGSPVDGTTETYDVTCSSGVDVASEDNRVDGVTSVLDLNSDEEASQPLVHDFHPLSTHNSQEDADEVSQMVPLESVNGDLYPDDIQSSPQQNNPENRLSNNVPIEHRKLKRKLSNSSDQSTDVCETLQKQTKFNNQTISIDLMDSHIDVDNSISNHVVNNNQITDSCDNVISFDAQNSQDVPATIAKSSESADQNFESELTGIEQSSASTDFSNDNMEHKYMNGHTGCQSESAEAPHEYKNQLIYSATNELDENAQIEFKSKLKNQSLASLELESEANSLVATSNHQSTDTQDSTEPNFHINRTISASTELSTTNTTNTFPVDCPHIPNKLHDISSATIANDYNTNNDISVHFSSNTNQLEPMSNAFKQPNAITSSDQQLNPKKTNTRLRIRRQVFLCSTCGTYYEKWNLFYHIREVHNKFICLFENCLGIFPNAERLVNHLETKHVHKPYIYEHKDDLLRSTHNQCFLMCCVCEHIFSENDDVTTHSCETFMKPCTACGLTFIHKSNCSSLLPNKSTKHKQKRLTVPQSPSQLGMPNKAMVNNANVPPKQMLLRNALLGQDTRTNHNADYNSVPSIPQDHRLNNLPPSQASPVPFPIASKDGDGAHQHLNAKLFMTSAESPANFHHLPAVETNSANIYHINHKAYHNLPNGQYSHFQADPRLTNPPVALNGGFDIASKTMVDIGRQGKVPHQDDSNSASSSDSDDSHNDSDSSSNESDADKGEKENNLKTVKPLRLNLNVSKPSTQLEKPHFNHEQNYSINKDESAQIDKNRANNLNDGMQHQNMSDITNIQMQLDNIKQQMNAMQKTVVSHQPEETNLLKVPKLKLKLSHPIQKPVDSEQSSTDSDSDSDNENEDEDRTSLFQQPTDISNETAHNVDQLDYSLPNQSQTHDQQYLYDASNLILTENSYNDIREGNMDESDTSTKNTSNLSDDKSESIEDKVGAENELTVPQGEFIGQSQIQEQSIHAFSDLTSNEMSTDFADDKSHITETNTTYPQLEHTDNVMTPPDSVQEDQTKIEEGNANEFDDVSAKVFESANDVKNPSDVEISDIHPIMEDNRPITEFILDQPLDKIPIRSFLRKCLQFTYPTCLYCNHARSIAVNGASLAEHLVAEHRFSATVDSITAEELMPGTIEQKIMAGLPELEDSYFNMHTYDNIDADADYQYTKQFECFQCRFYSPIYKDLYLHNRKMHLRSALICLMCRSNFYSYSELVCHMCPGAQAKLIPIDLRFRCVLCNLDNIPSAFRLMVHLRKKHSACDVCLEECSDQSKLSCHVWKHKLHHLCYRCNITYRNKADITRHLFWKHGTESVMCKRCLEKKWPHVYHFCVPAASFKCDLCSLTFSKALTLKVHKRLHDPESIAFACTLDDCDEKFISKKLMVKHVSLHYMPELPPPSERDNYSNAVLENTLFTDEQNIVPQTESIELSTTRSLPKAIEQEAPIDAVISVIEHDAREQEEQQKLLTEGSTEQTTVASEQSQKKPRRLKKHRSDFSDLLDLPTLNLSESDSSEESDTESITPQDVSEENSRHSLPETNEPNPKPKGLPAVEEDEDTKVIPLEADIWENFKTYQANQQHEKPPDVVEEDRCLNQNIVLLNVSQSDHDYAMMYKPLVKKATAPIFECPSTTVPIIEENEKGDIKITLIELPETSDLSTFMDPQSPTPLPASTVTISNEDPSKSDDEKTPCDAPSEESVVDKKPAKKMKADKSNRKGGASDSSSDSSDSDSSCSCGSNCSCSSSSSSSNSSSSDTGSDSSSSEGKRKQRLKVLTKTRKTPEHITAERRALITNDEDLKPLKLEEVLEEKLVTEPVEDLKEDADKNNSALRDESETVDVEKPQEVEVVDVVTTDKKMTQPEIYTIIVESDLETTDSETDEEFYDEHPQKLAIQMLAEKRQQLMLQTLNPINGMPYMDMSRPSTPLLPDEVPKEQKVRPKKRRRNHKNSRSPQKQFLNNTSRANAYGSHPIQPPGEVLSLTQRQPFENTSHIANMVEAPDTLEQFPGSFAMQSYHNSPAATPPLIDPNISLKSLLASEASTPTTSNFDVRCENPMPVALKQHSVRLSTSSCSDADNSLKRSKRRRIPNKFYGYTSDDEGISGASALNSNYQNPFKPTPPPNLTWSKEDLPKPSKNNRTGSLKQFMRFSKSANSPKQRNLPLKSTSKTPLMKNRTIAKIKEKMRLNSTPTVPKIIIRGISKPPQPNAFPSGVEYEQNMPGHHISASESSRDRFDRSSDSDSDNNLEIAETSCYNSASEEYNKEKHLAPTRPPTLPIPFIRPDHTLLPPKRFSLSPSPPPEDFMNQLPAHNDHMNSESTNLTRPVQQPALNGIKAKQENVRNDSNLYCYCRRPYDEMSEMIACDAQNCAIEWFHFDCVGITVAPQDTWYCPQCRALNAQSHYRPANTVHNVNSSNYTSASLDLA